MPIRTALWTVGTSPQQLAECSLETENLLEEMVVASPTLLSEEWMLIGRQVKTAFDGRIDLLAIAPDASLVLIELKRDKTPRDVVAQALDYASWLKGLKPQDIAAIYTRFREGRSLSEDFRQRFGQTLDEASLNGSHEIVIAAASLDESTERIVNYLNERQVPINVLCFQIFLHADQQLLSRSWLINPLVAQVNVSTSAAGPKEAWNGEFYCAFGNDHSRSWEDAMEFGFISAGGASWYSRTLYQLSAGDRIWVLVPKAGYVGVARVTGKAQPASSFSVTTADGEKNILDVAKRGTYQREFLSDVEKCEHFVPVEWLDTVPLSRAFNEVGLFGNQNTVCKPTTAKWRSTIERLKQKFPGHDRLNALAANG